MNQAAALLITVAAAKAAGRLGQAYLFTHAGEIETSNRRHGAEETIAALTKLDRWDDVADRMGCADGRRIALAPKLAPGSDAVSAGTRGNSPALPCPSTFRRARRP